MMSYASVPETGKAPTSGSAVGNGLLWVTATTVIGRVLTLLAQLVFAKLLLPSEFGVWAVALSLSTMTKTLQDMGIRELLVQRDHEDSPRFVSSVAFLGLFLNLCSAGLLVAAGFALAGTYGFDQLPLLCVIIAAQTLILGNWAVNGALLRRDLKFRPVALVEISGLITLFVGQVLAASLGAGVYAFALPLVASGIIRTALGMAITRRRIYRVRPDLRLIRSEIKPLGWLLLGAFAFALLQQADYLTLGFFMSPQELGFYFFAYQISAQVGVLISNNLQIVMFPVLSRMLRSGQSVEVFSRRMSHALLAGCCLMSSVVLMLFGPVELSLYGGKWSESTDAVVALAISFPLRALFVLPRSTLLALGRFAAAAVLTAGLGIGLLLVATAVGLVEPTSIAAAVAISAYLAITGVAVAGLFGRLAGQTPFSAAAGVLGPYMLWAVPAGGTYILTDGANAPLWLAAMGLLASLAVTCVLWRALTPRVWDELTVAARLASSRLRRSKTNALAQEAVP